MHKYHVIWGDYDGGRVDSFERIEEAEKFISDIKSREKDSNNNGSYIDQIIYGIECSIEPIQVETKFKITRGN